MHQETVLVLDFGGQYNQLIARRVRQAHVYSEILPFTAPMERIKALNPKGIIFTGGPNSVYAEGSPLANPEVFTLGVPILGICYGNQVFAQMLGGVVKPANRREYGHMGITHDGKSPLFDGIDTDMNCWMSHTDQVVEAPQGFRVTASTGACPVAAMEDAARKFYGVQFHPEVVHTPQGQKVLENFLYKVCGCEGLWTMSSFTRDAVAALQNKVGDKKVLLALSGGVDSSVAAVLLDRAVGKNLTCIFVDHGLLRKDEGDQV
jgi:GMP synthase (glutamine-hydrolysing)